MPSVVRWDHFFGRFPQQMARSQRKTSKAALAVSCKRTHCCGRNFQPSARVIDDMVLVLRLKSDHKKFSDIGESLSRTKKRLDVLFGVYRENSVKGNAEREH